MKVVEIIRLEESEWGTVGVLKIDKLLFCVTLEPPDWENERRISSIPAQQYVCKRYQSPRYKNTFQVTDVPGRSHILFHAGNTVEHTEGCVLLAEKFGKLRGNRAVLNSGQTFTNFLGIMKDVDAFSLTITENY